MKGDDVYTVTISTVVTNSLCTTLQIDRFYGPLNDPAANTGIISATAVGRTITDTAILKIDVNVTGAAPNATGSITIATASKTFTVTAAGRSTRVISLSSADIRQLILPKKGDDTTPPPKASNPITITFTGAGADRINVTSIRLFLPGMRPLILMGGFNSDPTVQANCDPAYPNPPQGVNHCLELTTTYFTWTFDAVTSAMLVRPSRDGHASIDQGGRELDRRIDKVKIAYGVAKVNILGHSMGGLWGRWATEMNYQSVDKLLMLGTPNHGNLIADATIRAGQAACATVRNWPPRLPQNAVYRRALALCNQYNAVTPALLQLTNRAMDVYNEMHLAAEQALATANLVTYIDLAGIATVRGVAGPIQGDEVVSVASVQNLPFSTHLPAIRQPAPGLPNTLHVQLPGIAAFQTALAPYYAISQNRYAPFGVGNGTPEKNPPAAAKPADLAQPDTLNPPTLSGVVASQVETTTIAVDGASAISFDLGWIDPNVTLTLSLIDPSGRVITPASTDSDTFLYGTLGGVRYTIQNPLPGNWQAIVQAPPSLSTEEVYYLAGDFSGGVSINPQVNSANGVGLPVTVSAQVSDSAPIVGAVVTASVSISTTGGGQDYTLTLADQGGGLYSTQFTPAQEGHYDVGIYAQGTNHQGQSFNRIANTSFGASSAAQFNDSYSEQAYDTNGNGLYDSLVISAGVGVSEPGNYRLSGCLTKQDGTVLTCSNAQAALSSGSQIFALNFDGVAIGASGADGPYQLRNLNLTLQSDTQEELITAQAALAYTTTAYSRYNWDRADAVLNGTPTEQAVDTNGNGLYDYLEVTIPLDVRTAGTYSASLNLLAPDGTLITTAYTNGLALVRGANQITLRFTGSAINQSGLDGPYQVTDLTVWNNTTSSGVNSVLPATRPYHASDFENSGGKIAFNDVLPQDPFHDSIVRLASRGIISGIPGPDGTLQFQPQANATRGQLAKVMVLAFGLSTANPTQPSYSDVPRSSAFYSYVEGAKVAEVISGLDTAHCAQLRLAMPCFGLEQHVSRAQVAVMVWRIQRYALAPTTATTFSDVPKDNFAYAAIESLAAHGVINGYREANQCPGAKAPCYLPSSYIKRGELTKLTLKAMTTKP